MIINNCVDLNEALPEDFINTFKAIDKFKKGVLNKDEIFKAINEIIGESTIDL